MSGDEDKGRSWREGLCKRDKKESIAKARFKKSEDIAQMATAADMDNLGVVTKTYNPFIVTTCNSRGSDQCPRAGRRL